MPNGVRSEPLDAMVAPVAVADLERRLIDRAQKGFPLEPRPYAALARELGASEAEIIAALERLKARGVLSRVGAVVRPNTAGVSTLAAIAVPEDRLSEVALLVSSFPEVNHNYEREHALNLWFVAAAPTRAKLDAVLRDIERRTGLAVIDLPLVEAYHIDLGFPVQWR
jgi:DNA-binding Lrp family transcriptional regulator